MNRTTHPFKDVTHVPAAKPRILAFPRPFDAD
jgi:hypothetical protein